MFIANRGARRTWTTPLIEKRKQSMDKVDDYKTQFESIGIYSGYRGDKTAEETTNNAKYMGTGILFLTFDKRLFQNISTEDYEIWKWLGQSRRVRGSLWGEADFSEKGALKERQDILGVERGT